MKLRDQILAIGLAGAAVAALVGAVGLLIERHRQDSLRDDGRNPGWSARRGWAWAKRGSDARAVRLAMRVAWGQPAEAVEAAPGLCKALCGRPDNR